MKIEAVCVSVNYSDFLVWNLLHNKQHFDKMVVVTDSKDKRTRDLCEHHHVECVVTDAFYRNEHAFDKGAGITKGLERLAGDDWICHLDADIVLPPRTRPILERLELNPEGIYGVDRLMCQSYTEWLTYIADPEIQHSCDIFVQGNAFPLGVRIAKLHHDGYVPIGFFQLWNAKHSGRKTYPSHGEADRSDMRFALQWKRKHRHLIPEILAVHLESEKPEKMGSNWRGRTTMPFLPTEERAGYKS